MTRSDSPGSTKRALTAGSSSASSEALETFMAGRLWNVFFVLLLCVCSGE